MKRLKIGLLCPYPPEELHQGYYALKIIENTNADFVKIGTPKSDTPYRINFKSFFLKEKIREIIRKEKIEVLHIQYIPPFFGSRYLNLNLLRVYSLRIPIITTLHEVYLRPKKNIKNILLRFIENRIVSNSKQIIVHNYMMADFLRKKYKTKKINTIVLGHYLKKEHKRIGKNILFFGVLSPGKGVEHLIKSMSCLNDYKLKIVGSIPNDTCSSYKEKILKEFKKTNLENIEIKTKKWFTENEKEKYFNKSDIVVLPYVWGPYNSAVTHDAIENVLPAIVTRVGAIYDIIERFKLGIIVKPRNSEELAEAIQKCFREYREYKRNIRNFRKTVSWKENGNEHLVVYKNAVKR